MLRPLARQELRTQEAIRRSYAWFAPLDANDPVNLVPGPPDLELIRGALAHLARARTAREVSELSLRSVALLEHPVSSTELDRLEHQIDLQRRSGSSIHRQPAEALDEGDRMSHEQSEAVDVARLFTAAIERAMSSNKLSGATSSGEKNRYRHEAIAQYLLDHILRQNGELEKLLAVLDIEVEHEPLLYSEWGDRDSRSRFDHVVDDRVSDTHWRSVLIIEDKLDAQLATDQLDRYCAYLAETGNPSKLIVLHPRRNPLRRERARITELATVYKTVTIEFIHWADLCSRMVKADPEGPHISLWRALDEFTESVGTGDLEHLPAAGCLTDPAIAGEIRDLFLTAQTVAAEIGAGKSRQLRFSLHGGMTRPWLQMALQNNLTTNVGLELDVNRDLGTLLMGVRSPDDPDGYTTPSKIRVFKDGVLTDPAQRRVAKLAELADEVRRDETRFPDELGGRPSGTPLSESAAEALYLLGSIFTPQAIRNPHRGGADSRKTRGFNEGERNERLGAQLVRDGNGEEHWIHLFIGPPESETWDRCTIWIRTKDGEREMEVLPGESGRDYVLRVWQTAREALER